MDHDKINSAGDFVHSYLNEQKEYTTPIENTQQFLDHLMNTEIPTHNPSKNMRNNQKNFLANQKARQNDIR